MGKDWADLHEGVKEASSWENILLVFLKNIYKVRGMLCMKMVIETSVAFS